MQDEIFFFVYIRLFANISWSVEKFPREAAISQSCSSKEAVIEERLDI